MKKIKGYIAFSLLLGLVGLGLWYGRKMDTADRDRLEEKMVEHVDVGAWISVEGTQINYPVVQRASDDQYYLSHDIEGNETYYGAIFMEGMHSLDFGDTVTILYGHAITDGAMFGTLDYFASADFFVQHREIKVTTPQGELFYDVIAAYTAGDEHIYHTYQLNRPEAIRTYFDSLEKRTRELGGNYRSLSFNSQSDQFLILSTCDAVEGDRRFVVHAVRRKE